MSLLSRYGLVADDVPDDGWQRVGETAALSEVARQVAGSRRVGIRVLRSGDDPIIDPPERLALVVDSDRCFDLDLRRLPNLGPLGSILSGAFVVGHDLLPDLVSLAVHHDVRPRVVADTGLAARLLDGGVHTGSREHFSLPSLVRQILGGDVEPDAWALLRLHRHLAADVLRSGLRQAAQLECGVLQALVDMTIDGVAMDADCWARVMLQREEHAMEAGSDLAQRLGVGPMCSATQVASALRRKGVNVRNGGSEELMRHRGHPLVEALIRWRALQAKASEAARIGEAIERHPDHRVRVQWEQLATRTGRLSCRNPNLLSLPREEAVRRCLVPAAGMALVVADYCAIELRVLADLVQEERLIDLFCRGGDPHRAMASLMLGVPESDIDDAQRRQAKAVNFGFVFGMGAETFRSYTSDRFGLELTPDEASRFRESFLRGYPGVARWHRQMREDMPGVVRTRSGRYRRFASRTEGYPDRLATVVQGTAADGMKRALVLARHALKPLGARVVMAVHDELLVEAPLEAAQEARAAVVTVMQEGMSHFVKSVPIEVSASVRASWAEQE